MHLRETKEGPKRVCDKFVGYFLKCRRVPLDLNGASERRHLCRKTPSLQKLQAQLGRHDAPTELAPFLGPLNYKYFASTRLIASVITHKFLGHLTKVLALNHAKDWLRIRSGLRIQ
ncbi:MAG: hypothetical protein DMG06_30755 [Acidobacteria bacterium]|nr:MAG: hypothetical protein DMG06_30755 [Acidobacteriota bacterium]